MGAIRRLPRYPRALAMELRAPPPGMVDLRTHEGARLHVGYHLHENVTGATVPGYGAPGAWLRDAAALRLRDVLADLARERLGLIVYDAYRPRRAAHALADYCEANGLAHLLQGYIARESRHSRGVAIDVGLVQRASGAVLPMGTCWDAFHPGSWYANATGAARVNRALLRSVMMRHGFAPYEREWWHFELPMDPPPPVLDVPYGADEPIA